MAEFDGNVPHGEKYSQSLFWHLYAKADECRVYSLRITLISYFFGFCLIGYVVFENLIWVVKYVLNSITAG